MENKVYWEDKKRIFGLPISFTRYQVTEDQLVIKTGFLNLRTETIKFFRVTDMSLMQPLTQRIFGVEPFISALRILASLNSTFSVLRNLSRFTLCLTRPLSRHARSIAPAPQNSLMVLIWRWTSTSDRDI